MNNGKEFRRSFRVSESVYIKYEQLSEREFQEGLIRRRLRLGLADGANSMIQDIDTRLGEAMYLLKTECDQIGKCIALLNDKLNAVIDQLPDLRKSKSMLAKLPPQTCDVGADGMVFATDVPFETGTKLFVRFLLESDNHYIETFCEVLRAVQPHDRDNIAFSYAVAVKFHEMEPSRKEMLIQHMFHRESETLRMRRVQLDKSQGSK